MRAILALLFCLFPSAAWAHTSERGFILLLPTEYYLTGGTAAVAVTFAILALVRPEAVLRSFRGSISLPWVPRGAVDGAVAALSFALFSFLIYTGIEGPRDPLTNPLPLAIWTLGWVGLTLAHTVFGNLWAVLNPWRFPVRAIRRAAGVPALGDGPLRLPEALRVWPACLLFMGIAWFELVDLAPDDPDRLAIAVAAYWAIGLIGCLLFGEKTWLTHCEPLTILFRYLSLLTPVQVDAAVSRERRLALRWPGAAVLEAPPPDWRIALFLILTLATVSFDGAKASFWWLGLNGINPLEFPGRSAVTGINSAGLAAAWAGLAALYAGCVWLGERLAGGRRAADAIGLFVLSILPISLAYHFSHYLTVLMVNGQWALVAANDPLGTGENLFGWDGFRVTTSFLNVAEDVERIWKTQVAAIVAGHVLAVILAHGLTARHGTRHPLGQIPLGILMIFYTLFGLWLLSTPTAG